MSANKYLCPSCGGPREPSIEEFGAAAAHALVFGPYLTQKESETMIMESFRYCLTRSSVAVSGCVERLKKYWDVLSNETRKSIMQETRDYLDECHTVMDMCDVQRWEDLLAFAEEFQCHSNVVLKGSNSTGLEE